MTSLSYSRIIRGITGKTEIILAVSHNKGNIIENILFEPYIIGSDLFEYTFVWGYLPEAKIYYKFMIGNILTVKNTSKQISIREDASYHTTMSERQFAILESFEVTYNDVKQILN